MIKPKQKLAYVLSRNSRKTECGAGMFLIRLAVRAAPFVLLGIALPATACLVWFKTDWFRRASRRREEIDRLQQIAVEDSFPASDPPSAW